ncbi:RCC1 domain-containing protein [Variovorax terrae]|uniref:Biotin transporter BioY n=1 Tax=Variovorax terrae TaxID=2923278 RepID=A0A9X2AMR4_9BURK|nr:biotin transporter BioY [Variovorax terrae]MCJ0763639.1 biotin transporter BioY [Variovorax terrae]
MQISLISRPVAAVVLGTLVAAMLAACGGGDDIAAGPAAGSATGGAGGPGGSPPATPTLSLSAPARAVANTLYRYSATLSTGTISVQNWSWDDGGPDGTTNPAGHVWNTPGQFKVNFSAVAGGNLLNGKQATVVVAEPMSVGEKHACAIVPGGTVACWGYNGWGQLGDGTTVDQSLPIPVPGLSGVVALSLGAYYGCALASGGTVACWGYNGQGQIGDGSAAVTRPSPVAVAGLSGAVALSAGGRHACAMKSDATVVCWGYNGEGQLGDGTTANKNTPVAVSGLSGVISVSSGFISSCALKSDGSVACWGNNSSGQLGDGTFLDRTTPVAVPGLSGVAAVSVGVDAACALKLDGTVVCWGGNHVGQLGDGTTVLRTAPVAVAGLAGAMALSLGSGGHACALKSDGAVACWGYNGQGQVGDGTKANRLTATPIAGLSGVAAINAGESSSCALKTDGTPLCWGLNNLGQVGDGTLVDRLVPTRLGNNWIFWK